MFEFLGATAATAMNSESSRSHAIFSITIETSRPDVTGEYHVKVGRLRLVDLAVCLNFNCCGN